MIRKKRDLSSKSEKKFLRNFVKILYITIGSCFFFFTILLRVGLRDLLPYKDREVQEILKTKGKEWKIYWQEKGIYIKEKRVNSKKISIIFAIKRNEGVIEYFDVSKKGKKLAVWINFCSSEKKSELWLVNLPGKHREKIYTSYEDNQNVNCWFSPSGGKLVFSCSLRKNGNLLPAVFVYNVEKKRIEKIIENATAGKIVPKDENLIIYREKTGQLFRQDLRTDEKYKIGDYVAGYPSVSSFAISPDGKSIIWISGPYFSSICFFNVKTKDKIKLFSSSTDGRWFKECKWTPDKDYFLVSERRTGAWFGSEKPVIVNCRTGKKSDLSISSFSLMQFLSNPVIVN